MAQCGEWLQIGGRSASGFGKGLVEVRVATGDESWEWRTLSAQQLQQILAYANSPDGRTALAKHFGCNK